MVSRILFLCFAISALLDSPAEARSIYIATKEYPFAWGPAPADLDQGMDQIRAWLEAKTIPPFRDATPSLRREVRRMFELEPEIVIKFVVLGPPRSENGKVPYFYAWVEWVHKSKLPFDLDYRRYIRKAGVAKVAIEGFGEKSLEIRKWYWAERLEGEELHELLPLDAAVLARKMCDRVSPRHLFVSRPRQSWKMRASEGNSLKGLTK